MDYKTTTRKHSAGHIILATLLLCQSLLLPAINPQREYSVPVEERGKDFEELQVETRDGYRINVWHLPSDSQGIPLIISESDAGNMGDWVHLGRFLQLYGIDVWLYDYRGFGASSDFNIKRDQLFYQEFVTDLSTVANFVYGRTEMAPILMGISMGSLILEEFLKKTDIPVSGLIFDGYVSDPDKWVKRLKRLKGKTVNIPDGYVYSRPKIRNVRSLYIVATEDSFSLPKDTPYRKSKDTQIKTFDCGHIMAFWDNTMDYVTAIVDFINRTREYSTELSVTSMVGELCRTTSSVTGTEKSDSGSIIENVLNIFGDERDAIVELSQKGDTLNYIPNTFFFDCEDPIRTSEPSFPTEVRR